MVLEAGLSRRDTERQAVDAEPMLRSEVLRVPVFGNAVTDVAAALIPTTMVGLPALCAMLLPAAVPCALLFLSVLGLLGLPFLMAVVLLRGMVSLISLVSLLRVGRSGGSP